MQEADKDPQYQFLRGAMRETDLDPEKSQFATVKNQAYYRATGRPGPERHRLHNAWRRAELGNAMSGAELTVHRHAIIMAGPPGAGKGTIIGRQPGNSDGRLGNLEGFVTCDPDVFKEYILLEELRNGQVEVWGEIPCVKSARERGAVFAPMHYAALVHEESSHVAKSYRADILSRGYNIVIDTVLKNQNAARDILRLLKRFEYTYEVVSVQTTPEISFDSIHRRWREGYDAYCAAGDNPTTLQEILGGRAVPSSFAKEVAALPSPTEEAAAWLMNASSRCLRYRLFRRDRDGFGEAEIDQTFEDSEYWPGSYLDATDPSLGEGQTFELEAESLAEDALLTGPDAAAQPA